MQLSAGFIILDIIYAVLVIISATLFVLYHKAFIKMHNTRVIKSVCFLMFALLIESLYFFTITLAMTFNISMLDDILVVPWLWSIPKLILLAALGYFLFTSLAPPDGKDSKCKELEKASNLTTILKKK